MDIHLRLIGAFVDRDPFFTLPSYRMEECNYDGRFGGFGVFAEIGRFGAFTDRPIEERLADYRRAHVGRFGAFTDRRAHVHLRGVAICVFASFFHHDRREANQEHCLMLCCMSDSPSNGIDLAWFSWPSVRYRTCDT